ncbi:cyclin-like protein [Metschnikowia bicuspidata var. bicuspidata NRRL YB-4993]|uniref:RNA polymerase II holoenzyme cyclin-like subunit n=1 Tax=Metschnikowia bicuspidata var. bicuspidata NRRL YB-4993 TaxID=869754 RepID=A0A1A0H6V5_9ASCO|nr:cyclin-like protein [Metschnikowia bicuspidata var. bicuspidata NRRL YB-4993]OBA19642.1 cyclin-like protein [Metschnikowia bicuspidata var. bicuspidata NRRL YB-4993]
MSADYWSSTQRTNWQVTREQLVENRRRLALLEKKMIQSGLIKDYPHINCDVNMKIYLHNLIVKLGRRLNVRQVALSSSEIYLSRFLTRVSIKEVNVYLLVTTCLYVACKMEECPQHIRLIVSEARNLWPEYIPQDVSKLAEFEFYLIEEMDMYLVLHHPYRSLLQVRDFLRENASVYGFTLSNVELQHSWSLINDSYITDLHLIFPPHIIAMAAIYITIILEKRLNSIRAQGSLGIDAEGKQGSMHIEDLMSLTATNRESDMGLQPGDNLESQRLDEDTLKIERFMNFFNHSHVNLDEVVEAMQEMIGLYFAWNNYNESLVRKALQYMLLSR